jgi:hypothetical protein
MEVHRRRVPVAPDGDWIGLLQCVCKNVGAREGAAALGHRARTVLSR